MERADPGIADTRASYAEDPERNLAEPLDLARGGTWQIHDGTATNFLLRLLRGEEPSRFLWYLQDADQHFFTSRE